MKKYPLFGLSLLLVAALSVAGTVAYLTDRDSAVNVFTLGNVSIDLTESFEQGAVLTPDVKIEKMPVITNTGKNDAWVWMTFSLPAALDNWNPGTQTGADRNVIHWNPMGATAEGYVTEERVQSAIQQGLLPAGTTAQQILDANTTWNVFNDFVEFNGAMGNAYQEEIEVNGKKILYNTYVIPYNAVLAPGETTLPSIYQVYLDAKIDVDPQDDLYIVVNGIPTAVDWNTVEDGAPVIYVNAYAVQSEGFASVQQAYNAYVAQWGELN